MFLYNTLPQKDNVSNADEKEKQVTQTTISSTFVVTPSEDINLTQCEITHNRPRLHSLHSFADPAAGNSKCLFIIPTEYASYRRARVPHRAWFKYLFSLIFLATLAVN